MPNEPDVETTLEPTPISTKNLISEEDPGKETPSEGKATEQFDSTEPSEQIAEIPATNTIEETQVSQEAEESVSFAEALGVEYIDPNYTLQQVMPSAFGLPGQLALLPNGDIVFSDGSYPCIRKLSNGSITTIIEGDNIKRRTIAAMPDGRVCYSRRDGELVLINPESGIREVFARTDTGDIAHALASDSDGNVYAVTHQLNLFRYNTHGERVTVATDLPWEAGYHISDIDVASDGTIYVAGWHRFISISPEGMVSIITDDLHSEPTWCEIDPEGNVYIKDLFSGVRRFNPDQGVLEPFQPNLIRGKDLVAVSSKEFIFVDGETDLFCSYNVEDNKYTPLFVNAVNSNAFAVNEDDTVFLATPWLEPVLKSRIIHLQADGTRQELNELSFTYILAANVDKDNRLYLATSDGFCIVDVDGTVKIIPPQLERGMFPRGDGDFAAGSDDKLYCISMHNDLVKVYTFDGEKYTFLPVSFDPSIFGNDYHMGDVSIEIDNANHLILMVTAHGADGRGPFCQRVYRCDINGENLSLIATLDSDRTGGMIDIAGDHNNNVFVLSPQKNSEVIYRIDENHNVSKILVFQSGRDPNALDVSPEGNVWFCTTIGVFRLLQN
jgi:streptogramin lyase